MPTKEPYIRLYDTVVQVWEDMERGVDFRAHGRDFRRRIQGPLTAFLRRRGWIVTDDSRIVKHHRVLRQSHRYALKGDLRAKIESSGRMFSIEIYQNKFNVTHPYGGVHEHNKRSKMPVALRRRCDLEQQKIGDFLVATLGYPLVDQRYFTESADQRLAREYRECWHTDAQLGRPKYNPGNKRISADKQVLKHGQVVWAPDRKGRLVRGTLFYTISSAWRLRLNRFHHAFADSHEVFASCPSDLRVKRNEKLRHQRLQLALGTATAAGDFRRVSAIQRLLAPQPAGEAKTYLLQTKQSGAWWKADRCGYTNTVLKAGRYTKTEAESIARHGDVAAIPVEAMRSEILEGFSQAVQVASALAPVTGVRGVA